MINKLVALVKREVLEHRNLWRVPIILVGIAVLLRISMAFGNLAFEVDVPSEFEIDQKVESIMDGVVARALNFMNIVVMISLFVVGIFYALSCLYNERQDQSVLFWRSLPVSDGLTIASKLIVALLLIPLVIVICQAVVSFVLLDVTAFQYLSSYYGHSLSGLFKILLWSMLPTIAWCVLCSEIAKKNPFLLAFIAPILLVLVDKLFLNGVLSETLIVNRLTGFDDYTVMPLIWGGLFAAVCIAVAIIKRSQRI